MDVKLRDVSLTYGDVTAISHLSLDIKDGESLVLLGESGCGKTSTMRCVAGLENPSDGSIAIGGTTVFDAGRGLNVAPNKRNVGLVFQSYAVWPHMSVIENVSFPLRMKRRPKKEIRAAALETLELVGLAHLADRGASLLSGGQMQRVALARSLAMAPSVMLLDEPLSNLDARLREDLRLELRRLQLDLGLTSIYVTHDQSEALALADRIAVMQGGRITQLASPVDTYRRPASATIAKFLGVANIFPIAGPAGAHRVRLADHHLDVAVDGPTPSDEHLSVCIRPEHVRIVDEQEPTTPNSWLATVAVSVFGGSFARCTVALDDGPTLEVQAPEAVAAGMRQHDRVRVEIDPRDVQVLPQDVGPCGPAEGPRGSDDEQALAASGDPAGRLGQAVPARGA